QSLPELKVMMFVAEVDRTYRASDYADPEWAYRSTHLLSTGVSALINGGAIEQEELEDWLGLSELNWPAYPPVPGVIDLTLGKQKLSRQQDFPEQPPAGWGAWDLPPLEAVRGSFHFHSREVTVPDGGNGEEMSYLKYWGTHATKKVWVLLNRRLTEDLEVPFLKIATKASTLDYQNEGTWYEGAINEATKVTLGDPEVVKLTVRAGENVSETGVVLDPLEANEGTFENERRYDVDLLPVEVKEVWSDQITGVEANGFPDKTGPNEYPYIFMGANTATTFKVKIKLAAEIPAAVRSQILFRWASEGVLEEFLPESGISTFSDGTIVQLSSDFNINVGRERFLVWAFDENKNGQIDGFESEVLIKMQHVRRGATTSIPCKFIPITQSDYEDSKKILLDWASAQLIQIPLRNSARHLIAFCKGTVPIYSGSESTTIKRNESGLSHPIGVAFRPTNVPGISFKATISKDHDLSKKLIRSNALRIWLAGEFNSVADGIKNDIIQERRNGDPAALLSYSITAKEKSLAFGVVDPDLLFCLGKVTFENPTIDFKVDMYGFVSEVKVWGLANDLYDFDREGEEILGYPARKASEVQAGFPSLGVGGKVFKTQIDMGGGNPYDDPNLTPYTFFPY
ncbi:hypothetical protein HNR46_004181, partial [Haloferula luteola]